MPQRTELSGLLQAWAGGDRRALDRLAPLVYPQLRAIARRYLRNERAGHTLQPTALVNEAFIQIVAGEQAGWEDRRHFFAFAAQVMRRILVDAARARAAQKRGGGAGIDCNIDPDEIAAPVSDTSEELIALEAALGRLERLDARKANVIELRFFGGLSVEECAGILQVSPQTVMRDWRMARVWLARELKTVIAG